MNKRLRLFLIGALLYLVPCLGGTIHLINNSSFPLGVVIRGHSGETLGSLHMESQTEHTWSDTPGEEGYEGNDMYPKNSAVPNVPYEVTWLCLDGEVFSLCKEVLPGGTVEALSCEGNRSCTPL